MAFSSQPFKAPSVKPKMGRTTVSSSIFSGNSPTVKAIKVPKGMGYGSIQRGPSVDPKYLPKKQDAVESSLVTTNELLVQIGRQLDADFQFRYNLQEARNKALRKEAEQRKKARKEQLIESGKRIVGKATSIISKPLAPAKSFLDKVFGFLTSVFQGFIVNKALEWLSDKENQKKVDNVINFLKDNWKVVLGIAAGVVGGVVLADLAFKLYSVYKIAKGLLGLVGIGRRGKALTDKQYFRRMRRGTAARFLDGKGRYGQRITNTGSRLGSSLDDGFIQQYGVKKGLFSKTQQLLNIGLKKTLKKTGLRVIAKALRPFLKRIPIFGGLIDFAVSLAMGEPIGRAAAKSVGAMLGSGLGSLIPIPLVGTVAGGILGDFVGGKLYDFIMGGKSQEAEGMNSGGIVPGGGPNRDSVLTYLTPGEGVVQRDMMDDKMYGPFVKDIIYNSGSLYNAMVFALARLDKNADDFSKINSKFGEILDEYKKICEVGSASVMGTGSGTVTSAASKAQITPTSSSSSSGITPPSQVNRGGNAAPTVLPTQFINDGQQKSKQIDADNSFAKYAPIDASNPYLAYVKKEFGILGV